MKTNELFEQCVTNCNPEVTKEVSDKIDKIIRIELLSEAYGQNAEAHRKKYAEIQELRIDLWGDMTEQLLDLVNKTKNKRIDFGILKDKLDEDGQRIYLPVDEECDEICALYMKDGDTLDYETHYGTTGDVYCLDELYILRLYEFISKHIPKLLAQEEE